MMAACSSAASRYSSIRFRPCSVSAKMSFPASSCPITLTSPPSMDSRNVSSISSASTFLLPSVLLGLQVEIERSQDGHELVEYAVRNVLQRLPLLFQLVPDRARHVTHGAHA